MNRPPAEPREPVPPAIRRALFACLRPVADGAPPPELLALDDAGWARLGAVAAEQRVSGLVARRWTLPGIRERVPAAVLAAVREQADHAARRVLRLHAELFLVLKAFEADGLPVILLKGAHLASTVFGDVGLRDMGDLDLLVCEDQLHRASDVMSRLGYSAVRPASIDADRLASNHLTRVTNGRAAVELHWNLTAPTEQNAIDPAPLWDRAAPIEVMGVTTRALGTEDTILHLCWHAAYEHLFGFGVRSLNDIAALLGRTDPAAVDWTAVAERAAAWRWHRGVSLSLHLARHLLGASVPDDLFARLAAVDVTSSVLDDAEQQLFADPEEIRRLGLITLIAGQQSAGARAQSLWRRVFLPASELAALYNRSPDLSRSDRWRLYPMRLVDLVRRHAGTAARFWTRPGTSIVRTADSQQRLRTWLLETAGQVPAATRRRG